ncbi:MAG: hypothetical protein HZC28_18945 [Spirochaetes bacterium]|nr:hypothetical protein [Spirochaetota bacterium]
MSEVSKSEEKAAPAAAKEATAKTEAKVSKEESGHAKNHEAFEGAMVIVGDMGARYQPGSETITPAALTAKRDGMRDALTAVRDAKISFAAAVDAVEAAFDGMGAYATRFLNAYGYMTGDRAKQGMKTLADKVRGKGAKKSATVSQSQMSRANRIESFRAMAATAKANTKFKPNESDLKPDAVTAYLDSLVPLNAAATRALDARSTALDERNEIMYTGDTSAYRMFRDVKAYVKSVEGASSPLFKRLAKLEFRMIKNGK